MFQISELSVCIKIISNGLAHRNSLFVVFLDIALSHLKKIYMMQLVIFHYVKITDIHAYYFYPSTTNKAEGYMITSGVLAGRSSMFL